MLTWDVCVCVGGGGGGMCVCVCVCVCGGVGSARVCACVHGHYNHKTTSSVITQYEQVKKLRDRKFTKTRSYRRKVPINRFLRKMVR